MKKIGSGLLAVALMLSPTTPFAHGEKIGPNGGVVEDAGTYHLELVMKTNELRAYVTDARNVQVNTKGAEATATVLSGKEKVTLKLVPAGANALAAPGKFDRSLAPKVVLSLFLPGQSALQARFVVPASK